MLFLVDKLGRLLLQHRDDRPDVLYPGHWAGFGGALEGAESVEQALIREMEEETGVVLAPGEATFFTKVIDPEANRLVHLAYLRRFVERSEIDLREGQGAAWCSRAEIAQMRITPFVRTVLDEQLFPLLEGRAG